MEIKDLLLIKDGEFNTLTSQQKLQILIAHTTIDPAKFDFMDKHCSVIWSGGLCYVRNQETYDKQIEEYKREYGAKEPSLVEFNIKVTMEERWVDDFCSMLMYMERCGAIGHSSVVGFYADGDGDFRPKFGIDRPFSYVRGRRINEEGVQLPELEVMFDAG